MCVCDEKKHVGVCVPKNKTRMRVCNRVRACAIKYSLCARARVVCVNVCVCARGHVLLLGEVEDGEGLVCQNHVAP